MPYYPVAEYRKISPKEIEYKIDPLPACLVSGCIDVLLPSITKMINLSLTSGHFPAEWKMALVLPLLKTHGLDPLLKNYRPISNLQFVSKLVERSVFNQLHEYLLCNNLYPIRLSICLYGMS